MIPVAIIATIGAIALPVAARGPAAATDDSPAVLSDAPAPEAGNAEDTVKAVPATVQAYQSQAPVTGLDLDYSDDDPESDDDWMQSLVTEEPVDGDEALGVSVPEQDDASDSGSETAPEAPAATPEPEVQIVYVYIEKEPEPEPEPEPEEPVGTEPEEPVDTEPPSWLVTDTEPEGEPESEAQPAPEWLSAPIDRAMWKFPYDGGPLCQKSWAQIPCAITEGTRAYIELDTPVIWLSQADLINFVGTSIKNCDADWFTIYGSDGYGIQFLYGNPEYAIYGPLDEYGQVTEVVRFIFLGEDGYYAVEPGSVD